MVQSSTFPSQSGIVSDVQAVLGQAFSKIGEGFATGAGIIKDNAVTATLKTKDFVVRNWKTLLKFAVAWAVIIVGTGLMYGFTAVALPMTIGIASGFAFGLLTGVVCYKLKIATKKDDTLWGKINGWLNSLDANGSRAIVISVSVTVFLATLVVFPIAAGIAFGVVTGNHLATTIALDKNLGSEKIIDNKIFQTQGELATVEEKVKELKGQQATLAKLQETLAKNISNLEKTMTSIHQDFMDTAVLQPIGTD